DAALDEREPADGVAVVADGGGAGGEVERAVAGDRERLGELVGARGDGRAEAVAKEPGALVLGGRAVGEHRPQADASAVEEGLGAEDERGAAGAGRGGAGELLEVGDGGGDRGVELEVAEAASVARELEAAVVGRDDRGRVRAALRPLRAEARARLHGDALP